MIASLWAACGISGSQSPGLEQPAQFDTLSDRTVTNIDAESAIRPLIPQTSFNIAHIGNNMHAPNHRKDLHDWRSP